MDIIFKEAKKIAVTLLVIDVFFIAATLIIGAFDFKVIVGAFYGFLYTVINFMLLGQIASNAIMKNPKAAKTYIQTHYAIRFMIAAVALAIAITSPNINHWIVVLSMFAPKIYYFVSGFYQCIPKRRK